MHGGRRIPARYTSESAEEEQIVQGNISTVHKALASIRTPPLSQSLPGFKWQGRLLLSLEGVRSLESF
jgi:hypothetical protein